MEPNPLLKALGLSGADRVVLIHTDDIGMCHASLAAYMDLTQTGLTFSGSTMVPCPWFPATARFCAETQGRVDMGVHITLTSEWRDTYRWGPVAPWTSDDGIVDGGGYLHATTADAQASARPEAVRREIAAQVQRALDAGIDVTHIDTHMGTVFWPSFLEPYVQTALERGIPPFLVRATPELLASRGLRGPIAEGLAARVVDLEARGLPLFDDVRSTQFSSVDTHLEQTKRVLSDLHPGLTYLITHPSVDTPELRAIMPERWQERTADFQVLMSDQLRRFLADQGTHTIAWRQLRDLMRSKI